MNRAIKSTTNHNSDKTLVPSRLTEEMDFTSYSEGRAERFQRLKSSFAKRQLEANQTAEAWESLCSEVKTRMDRDFTDTLLKIKRYSKYLESDVQKAIALVDLVIPEAAQEIAKNHDQKVVKGPYWIIKKISAIFNPEWQKSCSITARELGLKIEYQRRRISDLKEQFKDIFTDLEALSTRFTREWGTPHPGGALDKLRGYLKSEEAQRIRDLAPTSFLKDVLLSVRLDSLLKQVCKEVRIHLNAALTAGKTELLRAEAQDNISLLENRIENSWRQYVDYAEQVCLGYIFYKSIGLDEQASEFLAQVSLLGEKQGRKTLAKLERNKMVNNGEHQELLDAILRGKNRCDQPSPPADPPASEQPAEKSPEPATRREIRYASLEQKTPFKEWLETLSPNIARGICERIGRFTNGNLGDFKTLRNCDNTIYEARSGSYRIYFSLMGREIIILHGGHKDDQERDIIKADFVLSRCCRNNH